MKKEDLTQNSIEELIKREKIAKVASSILGGAIVIQFIVGLFLTFKQGFSFFTIMPICFLPLFVVIFSSIKKIRDEINSRSK